MDKVISHIWTLLCDNDDDAIELSIKDATYAVTTLLPYGQLQRYTEVPTDKMALVKAAAKRLRIRTDLYPSFQRQRQPDHFWVDIETRIDELSQSTDTHEGLLLYLIALLYTELPPRRNLEFQSMQLDIDGLDARGNTFDGEYFSFRRFKSSRRDGHQDFSMDKVTPRLKAALELWLKRHPCLPMRADETCYFLCNAEGEGYTKINSLTRLLQRAIGFTCQELRARWSTRFTWA